jgi:hypothetical protein
MWTPDQEAWRLTHGGMQARWDLVHPHEGVFECSLDGRPLPKMRLLQCRNSPFAGEPADYLVDHYQREDDLVATYVQAPSRANRKQLYLRPAGFLYDEPVVGIELIFSMQTDRLDGDPSLQIRSELPVARLHALVNPVAPHWEEVALPSDAMELAADRYCGAFAMELVGDSTIYAQVLDPSDFIGGRLIKQNDEASYALSLPVFGASLEKGVIRRGRVTGLFLQGEEALARALRFAAWYRGSPPPLAS